MPILINIKLHFLKWRLNNKPIFTFLNVQSKHTTLFLYKKKYGDTDIKLYANINEKYFKINFMNTGIKYENGKHFIIKLPSQNVEVGFCLTVIHFVMLSLSLLRLTRLRYWCICIFLGIHYFIRFIGWVGSSHICGYPLK